MNLSRNIETHLTPLRIAFIAIFLWSTQSLIMSISTKNIDFSAILFPAFLTSSLFFFLFKIIYDRKNIITHLLIPIFKKWRFFVTGSLFIFGSHYCFYFGIQIGPKVETNLANFLWPLTFILLSYIFLNEKLLLSSKIVQLTTKKITRFLGDGSLEFKADNNLVFNWLKLIKIFAGFFGVGLILTHGHLQQFYLSQWQGPILGFIGGSLWAIFSIYLIFLRKTSYLALFIGGTTILSGIFWYQRGCPNIFPTVGYSIYLGLFPLGLAMIAWERAMKKGHAQEIGTLAFLAPLFSTIFLYLAKFDYINRYSIIGGSLVVLANINYHDPLAFIKYLLKNDRIFYKEELNLKEVFFRINSLIKDTVTKPSLKNLKVIAAYFLLFIIFIPLKKLHIPTLKSFIHS